MKHRSMALLVALSMLSAMATSCTGGGSGDVSETDPRGQSEVSIQETVTQEPPVETDTESPQETTSEETGENGETSPEDQSTAEKQKPPVITLASTEDITVKAGETIQLPEVKVTDSNGRDITSWLEVTDNVEPDAVNGDRFCGLVAGKHTLYYFVETADGRMAEEFLTVLVEGAIPNTFDVQGMDNCENMQKYQTFRDDLESGRKSPMYSGIGDAGKATHLSSTEAEAIEGNSLVVDFVKSAGGAQTAIFFTGFSGFFHRNVQATYRVTFSYKLVEANDNFGDVYFGLSWDGFTGLNQQFIPSGTKVGEVHTCTMEFPATVIPEGGNAYFFLFKLNKTDKPIVVSFDNFIIETIQLKQVQTVVPTAAELAEGFTWDFDTHGATCTNGQVVSLDSLPEDMVAALAGREGFGQNLLKLTNEADHRFSGLTEENLAPGKVLTIDIDYYAVNDTNFYLIMMGRFGNPTQIVEHTSDGSFHRVHLETPVQNGWYQLNIYGQNNPSFEIYIGRITVQVVDSGEQDDNKTLGGNTFGMTFSQGSRQFGGIDEPTLRLTAYDGYDFREDADKMGEAPSRMELLNTSDRVIEWFRTGGRMENGYRYRITVTYYVDSFSGDGQLLYCFDRAVFLPLGEGEYMTSGYHEVTTEWTANRDVDYFCFYLDQNAYNGVIYVKDVTITLLGK